MMSEQDQTRESGYEFTNEKGTFTVKAFPSNLGRVELEYAVARYRRSVHRARGRAPANAKSNFVGND